MARLGSGVATILASSHDAAALVLDSPFSSAVDVAAVHYGLLPVRWLMIDQFRSDAAIRAVHIPVLIVHGDEDDVIPMNLAKQLFERANEPKVFISVAGGGRLVLGLTEIFARVREWIDARTGVKRHYGAASGLPHGRDRQTADGHRHGVVSRICCAPARQDGFRHSFSAA
jgi:fermentation-respiration switch protein FrsA (DUF1100 family)